MSEVPQLDLFSRDHRRLTWLAMCVAALAAAVGILLYLTLTRNDNTAEQADTNSENIAAQEAEQAELDAQQLQIDQAIAKLERDSADFYAYVRGQKPIPGAPGKDGLPSNIPGEDGVDGVDGEDGVDGATGQPGEDGRDATQAMADAALAAYCATRDECQGEKGDTGEKGDKGDQGERGPAPESFRFTFLGTEYECTDPNDNGAYVCEPI